MSDPARVRSVEDLRRFRASIADFIEKARAGVTESDMEVGRTLSWLTNDRRPHWRAEIRRRSEELDQAKAALVRRELTAATEGQTFVEYRKAIRTAEARLADAREKAKAVARWIAELERQLMLYQGQMQRVKTLVGATLPRASASLERSIERLLAYAAVAAPRESPGPTEHADPRQTPSRDPGPGAGDAGRSGEDNR